MKDEKSKEDISHDVSGSKFLLVKSAYRQEVIDQLQEGAVEALEEYGATFETVEVHGSLEIPAVISLAEKSGKNYDGYIALGCILKGETIHDEVIAYTVYEKIQDMVIDRDLAIGCGVLTVNTLEQAVERADPKQENRGREAALAALQIVAVKQFLKA